MRVTRNSKPLPSFEKYAGLAALLAILSLTAAVWLHSKGYVLNDGDAESRLNIARRIIDSRTPGYEQIGTGWLPLPQLLMLPLVRSNSLWQTGWAGSLPGMLAYVFGGVMMFGSAWHVFGGSAAALCAMLLFALNPNLLYLQATPMTEALFLAMLLGILFFSLRFAQTRSLLTLSGAAACSAGASLTRYDGWFLIPILCIYFFATGGTQRYRAVIFFACIAGLPPVYWLAHHAYFYSNPLEFYNGPYSTKGIYERALAAGGARQPGDHDWSKAFQYYAAAAVLCVGKPIAFLGLAGCIAAAFKRAIWPMALLAAPPAVYILSMYSGGAQIFVPHLWPNSYYNTRYGLAVLPLLAFAGGALVAMTPARVRAAMAVILVVAAIGPWVPWVTWKESEVNSAARREWTRQAADYLRARYRHGDGILFSFGDLAGVLRQAGIPLRESLHEGNGPLAAAVLNRPDLFMHEEWALAITGDPVSNAMLKLHRTGQAYRRVKLIEVKDAAPVQIYRRIRSLPSP